jgi:hypothetical protein
LFSDDRVSDLAAETTTPRTLMEFALILRELWRRPRWLALGAVVAVIAATLSVYHVSLVPPSLKSRSLKYSTATTQVVVDSTPSSLGNVVANIDPLVARAGVFANLMVSPAALNLIGEAAHIPGNEIYAAGPVEANEPRTIQEPTADTRNGQIVGEAAPYRLQFAANPEYPIITISAQAPTDNQAEALANGTVTALSKYISLVQQKVPSERRVVVRQLGTPTGAVVDGGVSKKLFVIAMIVAFFAWCVMLLVVDRFLANWRRSADLIGQRGDRATARPAHVDHTGLGRTANGRAGEHDSESGGGRDREVLARGGRERSAGEGGETAEDVDISWLASAG